MILDWYGIGSTVDYYSIINNERHKFFLNNWNFSNDSLGVDNNRHFEILICSKTHRLYFPFPSQTSITQRSEKVFFSCQKKVKGILLLRVRQ